MIRTRASIKLSISWWDENATNLRTESNRIISCRFLIFVWALFWAFSSYFDIFDLNQTALGRSTHFIALRLWFAACERHVFGWSGFTSASECKQNRLHKIEKHLWENIYDKNVRILFFVTMLLDVSFRFMDFEWYFSK